MIRAEGFDGGTPVRPLLAAIGQAAPGVFGARAANRLDLTIYPLATEPWLAGPYADENVWYRLAWTHPALARDAEGLPAVRWRRVADAGSLGRPRLIPVEQRLAELVPAGADGMSEAGVRLLGGRQRAEEFAARRQRAAVIADRTVETYDWSGLAAAVLAVAQAPHRPSLTPQQRAEAAGARLYTALGEVEGARASARVLLERAGQEAGLSALREVLAEVDPQVLR